MLFRDAKRLPPDTRPHYYCSSLRCCLRHESTERPRAPSFGDGAAHLKSPHVQQTTHLPHPIDFSAHASQITIIAIIFLLAGGESRVAEGTPPPPKQRLQVAKNGREYCITLSDLLVSVLQDGREPREQLRDRGLHLAHTDHVNDRLHK